MKAFDDKSLPIGPVDTGLWERQRSNMLIGSRKKWTFGN